ncbi:MAG: CDF family Co(II)/Ni(II) efflux transporter DmeF [Bdellovibrionales bacterium]
MTTVPSSHSSTCNQEDQLLLASKELVQNQRRTLSVVILTFFVMVLEIGAGYWTGSMALLADGYHMASHVGALGLSYLVYRWAQSPLLHRRLNFGTGKLLPLGGYTSAVILGLMAIWMIFESILRFLRPEVIHFEEALVVALLGLATNLISAWLLGWDPRATNDNATPTADLHTHRAHDHDPHHQHDHDHHDHSHGHSHSHHPHHHHHHHDHNHESAVAHVLADAITSVMAVLALLAGALYGWGWLDPAMGLIGAFVILKWAWSLCRKAAWELLDGSVSEINTKTLLEKIQAEGVVLHDFHLWKAGPQNFVCIVSVSQASDSIRERIRSFFPNGIKLHLIVENRA